LPSNSEDLCSATEATCAFIGGALVGEALTKEGAHLEAFNLMTSFVPVTTSNSI
jgi:hypothetical protein